MEFADSKTAETHLLTPRSGNSSEVIADRTELSASDLRSSSMRVNVSASIHLNDGPWKSYLKRWILPLKHLEASDEELDLLLNSEADTLEEWITSVSTRSVVRGFESLSREIAVCSQRIREGNEHNERQQSQVAILTERVKAATQQYRELNKFAQCVFTDFKFKGTPSSDFVLRGQCRGGGGQDTGGVTQRGGTLAGGGAQVARRTA